MIKLNKIIKLKNIKIILHDWNKECENGLLRHILSTSKPEPPSDFWAIIFFLMQNMYLGFNLLRLRAFVRGWRIAEQLSASQCDYIFNEVKKVYIICRACNIDILLN